MSKNYHLNTDEIIEQFNAGKKANEIAQRYGCSESTLYSNLRRSGINIEDVCYKYSFKNKEWLEEQFRLYGSLTNVARCTGLPRTCISRYAEKFGIRTPGFKRNKANYVDEDYFKVIDTEDKAYFLGFIMADGSMYKKPNGDYQFSFKIKSTDADIVYKFADSIQFDKDKIKIRSRYRKDTLTTGIEIRIFNQVFCNHLLNLGIVPRKSGKETFPKLHEELKRHFIRGFLDGDGSILYYEHINSKAVQFCSLSLSILSDIIDYFKSFEIEFKLYSQKTKNYMLYNIKLTKLNEIKKVIHILYDDSSMYLKRKYDVAMKILNI